MILSKKAILPLLWELFPGHPYQLPAYFSAGRLTNYVKKPILSREGGRMFQLAGGLITDNFGRFIPYLIE